MCCVPTYIRAELQASPEHQFTAKGAAEFAELARKNFARTVSVNLRAGGRTPKLVMVKADGDVVDVPVAQWTSQQIEDFCRAHLPAVL